ncbi:sulfotransferase family protein [Rhodobacter sp. KR11]|uniref:sulfotransferase family protein n=1 Tax=Rhodobacter sp. KR11 TaxID=2974588 RepID=UPI00222340F5|nr:sulfotransferase family protein [Rhodobacter sp. KR11]MCW1917807.1 sulfotransferase family protein [Rhodobacter sp. KR11]
MPIILPDLGLHYTSVPKNACTSIKRMFYEIEHGRPFEPFRRDGKLVHIHHIHSSTNFQALPPEQAAGLWKIAVLRDPLKRLVSVWRNRVMYHRELEVGRLAETPAGAGLTPRPKLEEFVMNLEAYRAASVSIRRHSDPHVRFLGPDPTYYDRLYQMSELATLTRDLSDRVGRTLVMPHEQTGGPKADVSMLSAEAVARARAFYAEDYQVFQFD